MEADKYPISWSMLESSILAAQAAISVGIENTEQLLAEHDINLGRTTRGNRYTAERLEGEINQLKSALDGIRESNGQAYSGPTPLAPDGYRKRIDFHDKDGLVSGSILDGL